MRRPGATLTTDSRLLLRLTPVAAALLPAPLLPAAAKKMPASLLLAKFFMTGVAGVIDRRVGGGDRRLVAGLDCGEELRSRRLHGGDQLIDVFLGRENLGFNSALRNIGAPRKQGPIESAGKRSDGLCCGHGIRAVSGGTFHYAANAQIKRAAHAFHRILAPLECGLAVLGWCR